jgi:two-component system, chemotaxis family, chemotaxis protein CheY
MKTLIVEDDFTSRLILQELLKNYGPTHIAVNGNEANEAVRLALDQGEPYDLICMDIMMPEMDGHEALRQIREQEDVAGIVPSGRAKIVMTTSHSDSDNVRRAVEGKCDYFLVKPIQKQKLMEIAAQAETHIIARMRRQK